MLIYELADRWNVPLEEIEAMPMSRVNGWLAYLELKKENREGG